GSRAAGNLVLEELSPAGLLGASRLQEEGRMVGNPQGTARCGSVPAGVDLASSYIATTYFEQGTALLRQGHYGESEWYLREALRLCPQHSGALNNLGTAVWQQNRAQEAEILYRRALSLAPEDFGILNNLGN